MTAPRFTLHQGQSEATFEEHPTELARKALIAAAQIETPTLARHLHRIAELLPDRAPVRKAVG
jgi:hypothetical protein